MTGRSGIVYKTFMYRTALRRCVELCFELMSNEASRLSRTMLRGCLELCFQMLSSVDCENRRLCFTAGVGYNRPVRAVYYRVGMPTITPPYCTELSLHTARSSPSVLSGETAPDTDYGQLRRHRQTGVTNDRRLVP